MNKGTNTWLIIGISFIATTVVFIGLFVWMLLSYLGLKSDYDTEVAKQVATEKKVIADEYEAKLAEEEKKPNREFVGPEDYGELRFYYPKTWSVYVAKDSGSGSTYEAYLNPGSVPPVSNNQRFALRVTIESKDYDKVVKDYASDVEKGDLTSSTVKANGQNGTRLDGNFTKDIRGSAVIYKIRDKTVTIRTDANTFKGDFDKLIKTIEFNE